ncbi:RNA polymerase sigma factor [Runella sp.]|uniref:RNA polymerase sigma factor n=1 Tax=Runella sp. TaxID=1960881 RepID=UPI003D11FA39
MTEKELIQRCLSQDRGAQRLLYDRYKSAMYTLAYRITGDFDEANSALQDTFLSVFRNLSQYRGEATLGAWIKSILVRKAYRNAQLQQQYILMEEIPTDTTAVDWGNDAIEAAHLEKAILSLPEGTRTVFVLAEIEGYTHREIAEMLSVSEGTSKSQLFYAKKRLRVILKRSEI